MNNKNKILVLITLLVLLVSNSLFAKKYVGTIQAHVQKESATCLPATNSNQITINNVRAYVETNGTMWFKEIAQYEVPRGSSKTSMFAAALWIGGRDVSGQLRLAAVRFRQVGDDYWTGPLTIEGASINQQTCSKYDKHFKITRAEVEAHIAAFASNDPTYTAPSSITQWPAHGENGQSYYLAPFKDVNEDGVYDYNAGDYPYYDLANELCPWTPENIALAAQDLLPWTPERSWIQSNYGYDNKMIYADHVLKGDETLFWIFNDKGGPHTESGGDPIGIEVRGQAFGFATNDELNNMTFYSYEIINRSTFALTNTFFSQWVDPDLGYADDDFVGCDVLRGLGYCYNGDEVDGTGLPQHYGSQPPAVGVDFFQGPYIDPDDRDNPHFDRDSIGSTGYCEKFVNSEEISGFYNDQMGINGVNFGDQIVDNERFGMRRFVYHNNSDAPIGDPGVAFEYYNLLQGIWKDGTRMKFGGNAHSVGTTNIECDFMFPGDTDPCNWGTQGIVPSGNAWTEQSVGNPPADRRFMQSAGPFTLKAGSVNYITVGIPWARATQGGAWASVELLKIADDKCQALFENCFKVLDGPDAPELTIRELNNELILYITNDDPLSNNYLEQYEENDSQIPDNIPGTTTPSDKKYRFEGYQIFQLKDKDVSVSEIFNTDKSRLVAQCDIENFRENGSTIGQLINWEYNDALGTSVPVQKVNGANTGLFHSLTVTEDAFAIGSKKLVNYKTYYFIAIAYAYNEYAPFSINPDIQGGLYGQKMVYLSGRKASGGRSIKPVSGIPHPSSPHSEGTVLNSEYGTTPLITRIQGQGNGGNFVDLTDETINKIMAGGDNNTWAVNDITYKNNAGPLSIKVIDPLKVQPLDYLIKFIENDTTAVDVTDNTNWVLEFAETVTDEQIIALGYKNMDGTALRAIPSHKSISTTNEQLFLPLGIAIDIENYDFQFNQPEVKEYLLSTDAGLNYRNKVHYGQVDFIGYDLEYKDPTKPWLSGVRDSEGTSPSNWIRSGVQAIGAWTNDAAQVGADVDYEKWRQEDMHMPLDLTPGDGSPRKTRVWKDPKAQFENIYNGTWAPYILSSPYDGGPQAKYVTPDNPTTEPLQPYFNFQSLTSPEQSPGYNFAMTNLYSVDVVLTPDKSKWTRCVVLEACDNKNNSIGGALKQEPRKSPSVDKQGNPDGTGTGFGWFPGYAINVETGERLNIMFSEDSSLPDYNGADMIFNPSNVWAIDGEGNPVNEATYNAMRERFAITGEPQYDAKIVWGGRHYIYVLNSVGNTAATIYRSASRYRNWNDEGYSAQTANGQQQTGYFQGPDQLYYPWFDCGAYDEGKWINAKFSQVLSLNNDDSDLQKQRKRRVYKMQLFSNVMWTSIPMPASNQDANWLSNEAKLKIRVTRPYWRYSSRWISDQNVANSLPNKGFPIYSFTTKNIAPTTKEVTIHSSILDKINVVPNPYYGYNSYESSALETYAKIINLPDECEISIFTVGGILVKKISKGDKESTFVTWDLKNDAGIPIAGGIYIIHVKAPNVGERTLKFFCAMRPTDLNAF